MKVIAFILSAYFLFLFAVPCCSFDNFPEEKTVQAQGQEEGDGDCGTCSPFFTCTGCSGFTVSTIINSVLISIIPDNQYPAYVVSFMPDINYDFWKPPKIG